MLAPIAEREQARYEVSKLKVEGGDWARIALASNEPYSRGRRAVLSSMTKRHFAGVETALCGRRNGTFPVSKGKRGRESAKLLSLLLYLFI